MSSRAPAAKTVLPARGPARLLNPRTVFRPAGWPLAGSLLCVTAAGLAFAAQRLLTTRGSVDSGRVLFGIAAVAAVAGIVVIDRSAPLLERTAPEVRLDSWRWRSGRRIAATAMIVTGAAASIVSLALVSDVRSDRPALLVWLAAILLVLAGAAIGARNRVTLRWRALTPERALEVGLVAAVLGLALALRLPDLSAVPAFVHGDEAAIGLEARRILGGGTIFTFGWAELPSLSYAIPAGTMWLFGNDLTGLRLASVIQSVLSILLLYLIVRRLFGLRVALIASVLLAVAQWDIHFSRQGSHYMQAQLATLLVLYFLLRALDTRRALDFLACGLSIGLCFEVYYAARLAPMIAALALVHRATEERGFLRRHGLGLLALVLGVVVFLAPMWHAVSEHPQAVNARSREVSLLEDKNMRYEFRNYGVHRAVDVLRLHTLRTVEAFNRTGETSLQYGQYERPLLDFWTAALLPLGALAVFARMLQARYFLLGAWIVASLVFGAILTIDAPFAPRLVAVIPALVVLPALVLDALWRGVTASARHPGWIGSALAVVGVLVFAAVANYRDYFHRFDHDHPPDFNTTLSHYLVKQGKGYRYYLIGVDGPSLRYDTQHFLVPWVDGVDVGAKPLLLPVSYPPPGKGLAFLVERWAPTAPARLRALAQTYPGGIRRSHLDRLRRELFISYVVSARDAAQAARG